MSSYDVKKHTLLSGAAATGPGAAVPCRDDSISVQATGTFSATVDIEVSLDGTNFEKTSLSFTAPGIGTVDGRWTHVRANVSAYTSGAVDVEALC